MKLAISNIAWNKKEDPQVVEVMRGMGVHGLEVAPTRLWERPTEVPAEELYDFRARQEAQGLRIVAAQALLFGRPDLIIFGESRARQATAAYLRQIIHWASCLGAKALVFGSPKNRLRGGMAIEPAMEIARGFFREVGDAAVAAEVFLCIEPNAKEYGCDFLTNTNEACELLDQVNHPGLGLHLDSGILALNREDVADALRTAKPYLRHFHISEPYLATVGSGAVNHIGMGEELRRSEYSGYVSIEMKAEATVDNMGRVRGALDLAQRAYLGTSP